MNILEKHPETFESKQETQNSTVVIRCLLLGIITSTDFVPYEYVSLELRMGPSNQLFSKAVKTWH